MFAAQPLQYLSLSGSGDGPTKSAANKPATKIVMIQPKHVFAKSLQLTPPAPSKRPTATVAPIWQCVVLRGQPWAVP